MPSQSEIALGLYYPHKIN